MLGKFICFCGVDGCGKTTQAELLVKHLEQLGFNVVHIRGFKPPRYSGELKDVAKSVNKDFHNLFSSEMRTISFILDLIHITANTIIPVMNENKIIISEKYFLDTQIYAPLLGTNREHIDILEKSVLTPDLYIFLDISAEESISRIRKRAELKNIPIAPKESIEIARNARQDFKNYYETHKENCVVFDAERDPQSLHMQISEAIKKYLSMRCEK